MSVEPKFKTPVKAMTDVRIIRGMHRIRDFFDRRAKEDAAEGDLFGGWDWPTMSMVYPELVQKHRELQAEAERRLEASGGLLNGVQYEKTERGWKVKKSEAQK